MPMCLQCLSAGWLFRPQRKSRLPPPFRPVSNAFRLGGCSGRQVSFAFPRFANLSLQCLSAGWLFRPKIKNKFPRVIEAGLQCLSAGWLFRPPRLPGRPSFHEPAVSNAFRLGGCSGHRPRPRGITFRYLRLQCLSAGWLFRPSKTRAAPLSQRKCVSNAFRLGGCSGPRSYGASTRASNASLQCLSAGWLFRPFRFHAAP